MSHISLESNGQILVCELCFGKLAIHRSTAQNPELMTIAREEMERDHRECTKYPEDPMKAKLLRAFRKRMEREISNVERKVQQGAPRR